MIRLTEPMPCPRCRRLVLPGEDHWYDVHDDMTVGGVHLCAGAAGGAEES